MALFVADWLLPKPVAHPHSEIPPNQRVNLQIRSNHKWPERVVFDTAHSGRSFAEANPGPDFAAMEHRGLSKELAEEAPAQAPKATDDKAAAISAKPGPEQFRMTGTIKVD